MDGLLDLVYSIPLLGLVFQFLGYLIATLPDIAPITLRAAVPIGFAALCGVLCERSGVVNIGIEGTMLTAAFVGWASGVFLLPILGQGTEIVFGITLVLILALALAILSGLLVAAIHAWRSISVRADRESVVEGEASYMNGGVRRL